MKVKIIVEGQSGSGKTTIASSIAKSLRKDGFDVIHDVGLDYSSENEVQELMSTDRVKAVTTKSKIVITERHSIENQAD